LGSDASTLTGSVLSGTFASSQSGNGIPVSAHLTSLSLGNSNYFIAGVTFPLTANIAAVPDLINNMATINHQLAAEIAPDKPQDLIKKGDVLYVRDNDDLPHYIQVIELPPSGEVKYPIPDQLVQMLIDLSGDNDHNEVTGYKLLILSDDESIKASLVDGSSLPAGVQFNEATRTFVVPNISEVTLPLSVKLTMKRQGAVVSEKIMVLTK